MMIEGVTTDDEGRWPRGERLNELLPMSFQLLNTLHSALKQGCAQGMFVSIPAQVM